MTESVAERVDLAKRACEATIEITRQVGAELTAMQGECSILREEAAKMDVAVRQLAAAHQHEQTERKAAEDARDRLQSELDDMDAAVNAVRKVFSETYGRGEALALSHLTEPMKRALRLLLSKPGHYRTAPTPAEAIST